MIIFQTEDAQIDLTHLKPSLIEESNWFVNDSLKNYSLPFTIDFENEVAKKLGLANVKNIATYKSIINGTLIIDDDFFNAYLKIGEVQGKYAEATILYGPDVLSVYDRKLKDLPWPTIVTTKLIDYAKSVLNLGYPEVTHNFPALYRPEIKEQDDYTDFLYFVNYYQGGAFKENLTIVGTPTVFQNFNVMAPFPYMLEILRFGFAQEGKEVRGELFETDLLKKVVYVPDNYFQRFLSSQYDAFSFDMPLSFQIIDGVEMGVYERVYTPTLLGTYELKFDINLALGIASYFSLIVTIKDATTGNVTTLYNASSSNSDVNISEELEITVETNNQFDQIKIQLIIPRQSFSISPYNSFEYNYSEGRQNVFPAQYTLANFMPDMTFGTYVNTLKNWLNLDVTTIDNAVYFDFIENKIQNLEVVSKEHLQDPDKKHKLNTDRFYNLNYNNAENVRADVTGQVFTNASEQNDEIVLDMPISPLKIQENYGFITGVFNKDAGDLRFGIYDGLQNSKNVFVNSVADQNISLQQTYNRYWKLWLNYRCNSKTFKDTFEVHISELFDLKKGFIKYNELHIIKKIIKKRISSEFWKVDEESETL